MERNVGWPIEIVLGCALFPLAALWRKAGRDETDH
jgi:hypothetical protein